MSAKCSTETWLAKALIVSIPDSFSHIFPSCPRPSLLTFARERQGIRAHGNPHIRPGAPSAAGGFFIYELQRSFPCHYAVQSASQTTSFRKTWPNRPLAFAGTVGGAASGATGAIAGAELGSTVGIIGGPIGRGVGAVAGAAVGALLGALTGHMTGSRIGRVVDRHLLDNMQCRNCGLTFRTDEE